MRERVLSVLIEGAFVAGVLLGLAYLATLGVWALVTWLTGGVG